MASKFSNIKNQSEEDSFEKFKEELLQASSFRWLIIVMVIPIIIYLVYWKEYIGLVKFLSVYIPVCVCIFPLYIQIFREIRANNRELRRQRKIRQEDKENERKRIYKEARPFFSVDFALHERSQSNRQYFTKEFNSEVFSVHVLDNVYDYYNGYKILSLLINNFSNSPMLAVKVVFKMQDGKSKESTYLSRIDPAAKIMIYSRVSDKSYKETHPYVDVKTIHPKSITIYFVSKLNEKVEFEYLNSDNKLKLNKVLKESEGDSIPIKEYNPEDIVDSYSFEYYFKDKI